MSTQESEIADAAVTRAVTGNSFDRAWKRWQAGGDRESIRSLPRRQTTFVVDFKACAPGIFDADFEVTIGSMTADMELEANRGAQGDAVNIAWEYARLSIVAVDGKPLSSEEAMFFWEALGQGGRQLIVAMFARQMSESDGAMGKALGSARKS